METMPGTLIEGKSIGSQSITKLSAVSQNGNQEEVEKNLSASKTRFQYSFQDGGSQRGVEAI